MGTMKESSYPGKGYSEFCTLKDIERIPEGEIVLVIGQASCVPSYSSPKDFYEISWRGDSYFIEPNKVLLEQKDLNRLATLSTDEWREVRDHGIYASNIVRRNQLSKVLEAMESAKPHGLAIVDWSVIDESEYTKGTGIEIQPYNPTKKTVKYIWFTIQGYNPVDDPVGSPATLKAVGPLEPDSAGTYRFEYTWMTDLVETAKFRQIRIQYMDGTQKVISAPSKIIFSNDVANTFNE